MLRGYSNEFGKVFVVSENSFVLEKYYDTLDVLFNDEYNLIKEIINMDFVVIKKTIQSIENKKYLRIADWRGVTEPNGPEHTWMIKFDLEYKGD